MQELINNSTASQPQHTGVLHSHSGVYLWIAAIIALTVGGLLLISIQIFQVEEEVNTIVADSLNFSKYRNKQGNETKDWKTYRNEEYGFEFKYPQDYNAYPDGDDSVVIVRAKDKEKLSTEPTNHLEVRIKDNTEILNMTDWWFTYGPYSANSGSGVRPDSFPIERIKVGERDAIRIAGSEGVLTNYVIVPLGSNVLEIMTMADFSPFDTFKFEDYKNTSTDRELKENQYCGNNLVNDPEYGQVVANCVIIITKEGVEDSRVKAIIKEIGGLGYSRIPEISVWVIVLPPSKDENNIRTTINKLKIYPEIKTAEPNAMVSMDV